MGNPLFPFFLKFQGEISIFQDECSTVTTVTALPQRPELRHTLRPKNICWPALWTKLECSLFFLLRFVGCFIIWHTSTPTFAFYLLFQKSLLRQFRFLYPFSICDAQTNPHIPYVLSTFKFNAALANCPKAKQNRLPIRLVLERIKSLLSIASTWKAYIILRWGQTYGKRTSTDS